MRVPPTGRVSRLTRLRGRRNNGVAVSAPQEPKRSPLENEHVRLGARLVPFAGWRMPVQYGGILEEHRAVRGRAGVFDISHMGEFLVSGPGASAWLEGLLTNRIADLEPGGGQYTLMCNEAGGVIDDLIAYRIGAERFLLVVNAAKIDEDRAWLEARLPAGSGGDVAFEDRSPEFAAMAVQGPDAPAVWTRALASAGLPDAGLPPRNGIADTGSGIVCRTGYTGEDGFEWFVPADEGAAWFRRFTEAGAAPCGLGARDTLRLEMGFPLNGSDLLPDRTPLEAGLGFFVDLDKPFVGAEAMRRQKDGGLPSRLAAFRMAEKGPPPRAHYPVEHDGRRVGEVTSGGLSPSLGVGIGLAYLPPAVAKPGTEIAIDVRGRRIPAEVVKKPIYRKPV